MGYHVNDSMVRGDLFNPKGKWKYAIAIDMSAFWDEPFVHDAVLKAVRATPDSIRGVVDSAVAEGSGYVLVVLEPSHRNAYPVMLTL